MSVYKLTSFTFKHEKNTTPTLGCVFFFTAQTY